MVTAIYIIYIIYYLFNNNYIYYIYIINTFYWNTARLIHLCFVYGCLHAKVAELKS